MALGSQNRRPVIATNNGRRSQRDEDFVPAEVWLNVGYMFENEKGEEDFVGLDKGIPVDQIPNAGSGFLGQAKNNLRDQLLEMAEELEPGEARLIALGDDSPLQLQLRRRNPEAGAVNPANTIAKSLRKLAFAS